MFLLIELCVVKEKENASKVASNFQMRAGNV